MTPALVEVGIAQRPLPGEIESGDRCVVALSEKRAMLGVVDGLGHGSEAAQAADAAAEVLNRFGHEPVSTLMQRCHERLKGTRGAAITIAAFDGPAESLEWVGAGNVAASLLRYEPSGRLWHRELLVRSGVAGVSLPSTAPSSIGIARGDTVVVATDGLRPEFAEGIGRSGRPQQLAEDLLAQFQMAHDDALVVVARVRESAT